MSGDFVDSIGLKVYQEIQFISGGRIVNAWPNTEGGSFRDGWPSLDIANHNVFRLDAADNVVWQVRRVESPTHASWEELHELARRRYAEGSRDGAHGPEGYWDPFNRLYMLDCPAVQSGEVKRMIWQPGCTVYINTRMTAYLLDVETGIATCTGDQLK